MASDLGGHAVGGGGTLRRGLLFRISGGLAGAAELAGLDDLGLRVLVDLRGPDEDRSAFQAYCRSRNIGYCHRPIPLGGAAEVHQVLRHHGDSVEDARRFLAAVYRRVLDEFGPTLAGAVAAVAEHPPAGFGCAAGKDRTGLVAALLQDLVGVDRAAIVADYVALAPNLDQLRPALSAWWGIDPADLDQPGLRGLLEANAEVMEATLDYLDARYGGTLRFLQGAGLPPGTVDTLRHRFVASPAR